MARQRLQRIQEAVQQELGEILQRELRDPRIGFASVTGVEVSDDLRHARVYVSVLGDEAARGRTLEGLSRAHGFIRTELGRRLRLRTVPELSFVPDRSLERGARVSRLLARAREEASPEVSLALDLEAVTAYLRDHDRFLILLHLRPDGDSVGSSLALALGLGRLGKRALVVRADELPRNLGFLAGIDRVAPAEAVLAAPGEWDAAILIDCGDPERVGASARLLERAAKVINIDHHLSNARYGDLNCIETNAAAAGEVVFRILKDLEVPFDPEIAGALYAAIVTDTGSFRYESTSARTHEIAAELLRHGVRPGEVSRRIWEEKPVSSLRLLERALGSMGLAADGALAWVSLSRADFEATGADRDESEGIVNYPRTLAGVEVAVLFQEEAPPGPDGSPGEVKVSLRSNRWVDVSRLAAAFGGGGHARAAGCTLRCGLEEARSQVLARAAEALEAGPPR